MVFQLQVFIFDVPRNIAFEFPKDLFEQDPGNVRRFLVFIPMFEAEVQGISLKLVENDGTDIRQISRRGE
jgi:hypothetical protein